MKYGFIGLGNMASAIISGMIDASGCAQEICGVSGHAATTRAACERLGITGMQNAAAVASAADTIVLAVKPQVLPAVLPEIKPYMSGKLVISIAAGKTLAWLREGLGNVPMARVMPNVCARVGASVSGVCFCPAVSEAQKQLVQDMFSPVGTVLDIPESQFAAFSAVAGASPAFTFMYIDALTHAAVRAGVPRALALQMAAHSVEGAAKLASCSGEHPMALLDTVCSPGGTTIEGVCSLREDGFEAAVHNAIDAVIEKDRLIGK